MLLGALAFILTRLATRPTAEALRRQNEFIASASHELRSPLAVIKASLAAANRTDANAKANENFLQTADKEAGRMGRLIDDLLLLASGDANSLSIQNKSVNLDNFCIALYENFHLLARARGHELKLDLPRLPLPTISADSERLTQIFSILINNAIEYSGENMPIEIHVKAHKNSAAISVIDHGMGIKDEEKDKVFHRFYRVDKSRTDKAHFGLGLSVAKELAAMHKSSLTLRDTVGGGCTFTVVM